MFLLLLPGPRCSSSWPVEQLRGTFLSWRRGRFLWSRLFCGLLFPQLQFIARWSMSSSCWYCRFHRCSSWRSWLTCPLSATSGAGRVLCSKLWRSPQLQSIGQLVRRLRRLWTNFTYFLHDGGFGSGGRFSQWKFGFHEPLVSGSHSCSCVSYDGLWKNFIFILREGLLDLRSILVLPAWFAQGNLDIISGELPVDV